MDAADNSLIKQRDVVFCTLHPDPRQAQSAAELLGELPGILQVAVQDQATLKVRYHILEVSLAEIEQLLSTRGFHLSNALIHKLRRALYRYTEETERANLGCAKGETNCTKKVFATAYRRRSHGCQDARPDHWRRYL